MGGMLEGAAAHALAALLERESGDAVIIADSDDRVVRWSARAEALFGRSADDAYGRPMCEVLDLPVRANEPSRLARLRAGERCAGAPDPARRGARIGWSATPIHEESVFQGAVYQVRPVEGTAASDPESSLVARAFASAFESMAVVDRQRRVRAANESFQYATERVFGRRIALGDDLLGYAAPGSEAGFLEGLDRAFGGERVQRERSVRYANGHEYEHIVEYTPLSGPDGVDAVLFGSLVLDLAARPVIRRELVERGLAVAPFSVLITDTRKPGMPIVYASGAVERLTGYRPEELVGRNPRVFHGGEVDQPGLDVLRQAVAKGTACDVVVRNRRKNGETFLNRVSLTPVRDDLGTVSHFIGIQEDVTERERLLARLRDAESRRFMQLMLGGAVHDLRNLLTVVFAALDELRDHAPQQGDSFVLAEQAMHRASALTRLLLSPLTRSTSMSGSTEIAPLIKAIETLSRYILPREFELVVELDEASQVGSVVGAQGGLEQVFLNLLLNARDAMPKGGRIGLSASSDAGSFVIRVRDEGAGIPEDVLPQIFEPYFTTKPAGSGHGVGLPTCLELVKSAGGTIEVSSQVSKGSTFAVVLPAAGRSSERPERRSIVPSEGVAGMDVLVVEPDTQVRGAVCALLRRRGARIVDAGDVETAFRLAAGSSESALLLLGDAAIFTAACELVEAWLAASPSRSVLLLDASEAPSPMPNDERIARLAKPFSYEGLLAAIARLTQR